MNTENKQKSFDFKEPKVNDKIHKLIKTDPIKRNSDGERFAQIALLGAIIFHADDLAHLWKIYNKNTLHKTLSRYTKRKLIFRIYNGFYSIKKINDLDSYLLGIKSLPQSSYISCESILYEEGILKEKPKVITLVSSISKSFSIGHNHYQSRQMSNKFIFNNNGIEIVNGVRKASVSRATADMLYFDKNKNSDYLNSKLINLVSVNKIIKSIGYKIKNLNLN